MLHLWLLHEQLVLEPPRHALQLRQVLQSVLFRHLVRVEVAGPGGVHGGGVATAGLKGESKTCQTSHTKS